VLGEFRELTKAVREGDVAAVSTLCAQLFDLNSATKVRPQPHPHRLVGIPSPRRAC
jgi:hypothetical protein